MYQRGMRKRRFTPVKRRLLHSIRRLPDWQAGDQRQQEEYNRQHDRRLVHRLLDATLRAVDGVALLQTGGAPLHDNQKGQRYADNDKCAVKCDFHPSILSVRT